MYPGSGRIAPQFTDANSHGRPAAFAYVAPITVSHTDADANADAHSDAHAYRDAGYRCVHRYGYDAAGYVYGRPYHLPFADNFRACQWGHNHRWFFCGRATNYRLPI